VVYERKRKKMNYPEKENGIPNSIRDDSSWRVEASENDLQFGRFRKGTATDLLKELNETNI